MTALKLFVEVGGSYVCFGLALYAISAIASFGWVRLGRHEGGRPYAWPAIRICACTVVLIGLELARQLCDGFHADCFPVWAARIALPVTYLIMGNAAFGLVHQEAAKQATEEARARRAKVRRRPAEMSPSTTEAASAESGQLLARVTSKF